MEAAKHLLRYLKNTSDARVVYERSNKSGEDILKAYSNAAFGNSTNYKSISGYVLMFNDSPICWSTRKQHLTAQSTTESEYIALSDAGRHVVRVRHLLYTLSRSDAYTSRKAIKPTIIYEDNQGSIALTDNLIFRSKTKHIQVKYHYIRDMVKDGEVKVMYMPTSRMLADGLTKALPAPAVQTFREELNMQVS